MPLSLPFDLVIASLRNHVGEMDATACIGWQGMWGFGNSETIRYFECLVKAFKTHRAEIDFNAGCVNGFVKVLQGISEKS
jgi:hypothetical protein